MQDYLKILYYLEPHGVGKMVDMSPILLDIAGPTDLTNYDSLVPVTADLLYLLNSMADQGFIRFEPFKVQSAGGVIRWIHNSGARASLEINGQKELEKIFLEEQRQQLHDSIISANKNAIDNSSFQKKMQWYSIILAVVSGVFIAVSVFQTATDTTSKELQRIRESIDTLSQQLKQNQGYQLQITDSISQLHIPDSIRSANSKTSP